MKRKSIDINDINLLTYLRKFIKTRENILNNIVSLQETGKLYKSYIKPLQGNRQKKKGINPTTKMSPTDMEIYAGNLFFTGFVCKKKHKVSNWSHPSQIKINNLTPDFSINNDSEIIEIYSPVLEIWLPISIGNVQEKSEKYRSYLQLKILIHIFVDRFINDDINSLKKVPLANKGHAIFLYHGENEIPI